MLNLLNRRGIRIEELVWELSPAYGRGGSSGGDGLGAVMMGGIVIIGLLILVLLVLGIWAAFKAVDLVIRAWRQSDGKSRSLRVALFTWIGLIVALALVGAGIGMHVLPVGPGGEIAVGLGVIFLFATISLLITARATELKYRQTFAAEPETLITKVLRRPWWTTASKQAA